MKYLKTIALSLITTAVIASSAYAASVNRTVPAGKTSPIFVFYQYNKENCSSMAPPKTSLRKAAHGKLSYKRTPFRVKKGVDCAGMRVQAITVYYKPDSGYRGKDRAKFGFNMPQFVDGEGYSYYGVTANITVK